jgi:putative sigma-54 modulation protein
MADDRVFAGRRAPADFGWLRACLRFLLARGPGPVQNPFMQIHLSPRNIALTGAIHAFIAEKITHLEEHGEQILAAHVVLLHDQNKKKPFVVKVHLAIPGPDIYCEDAEADLYAAIDKVVHKLAAQLSKRKTRRKDHKKHLTQLEREAAKRGFKRR